MAALVNAPSSTPAATSATNAGTRKNWEAADTIVATTAALLVVIFASFGLLVWQAFGNVMPDASARAERTADVLSEQTSLVVGASLAFLDAVAGEADGDPTALSSDDLATLAQALSHLPAGTELGLYDAAGRATEAVVGLPAEIAATSFFDVLSRGTEWIVDTLPDSGDLVVARRLARGGVLGGVALLRIDHSMLATFWSLMDFSAGSTVSIVREDGLVLTRHPPLGAPLNLSGRPAFALLTSADSGSYASESSPADGVARIVGFQHVPELGLIALASLATEAARTAIWTSTWIVLALLGPIALALLVGSWMTARVLRRSEANRRELAAAVAHNEVLFGEIHHRVKNNLQSVNSLLQLQPIPKEIRKEMGRRISAMSAVHEHIYRSGNFATVAVRDYLRTLIRDIERGQGAKVEVTEHLEDLAVDKDVATPLALIINEVLSNAFKHAFADGRDGKLTLNLVRNQDRLGHLTIRDNGVGFDPAEPSKGIGQRLITALTGQIGGTASYSNDGGTRFDLTFPLAPSH